MRFAEVTFDLGSAAEWSTTAVALVALVLSALAFGNSLKSSRRLSFMALEERLITEDAARGRRELYRIESFEGARKLHRKYPEKWDRINQAVVFLNKLAEYEQTGLIDRKLAKVIWGGAIVELWPHVEHVVRYRRSLGRADKWATLVEFASRYGASVSVDLRTPDSRGGRRRVAASSGGV